VTLKLGLSFWLAAPLAMVTAGAIGALVGVISLRIRAIFWPSRLSASTL
jgi:ABC-type branched-subunit amino acid transport system permease subunit